MNTVGWVVVAVVAILLIIALVFIATRIRTSRRRGEAVSIREEVRDRTVEVERREALAEETAARARAAKAEADAKVAEAARLEGRATAHHSEVAATREELNKQSERADRLDPAAPPNHEEGEEQGSGTSPSEPGRGR